MKASIQYDKTQNRLHGKLGLNNVPYTAQLKLKKPDGVTETLVVPSSKSDEWEVGLDRHGPGKYEALIVPREAGAFEPTRCEFTL
ncbi:hypothetical protein [Pseudomonas putida]|uniref:hypothetical protein n=1 Tax=Pseudomonas putida TaxID=303 RepID=UPI00276E59F5|nr:hypothetical protein [Pseudomonas putida]EKT4483454.1 hypothetical protein [Pseudomonas putida]MDP9522464.1 hypothetical protein [Pseudomonas putida]